MAVSQSLNNASLSISQASSISSTIGSNPNNITNLGNVSSTSFVSNITNTATSAVNDPIAAPLNKILSTIGSTTSLVQKKINDLTTQLVNYQNKNTTIKLVNNTIVITTTSSNEATGQIERNNIQAKIDSIKNTLNILNSSITTLQSINTIISVLMTLLTIQEALIGISGIPKIVMTVLKQAIKVIFLKQMLGTYVGVIENQLTSAQQQFNQLQQQFLGLNVTLNIQDNTNNGNTINVDQALSNISQQNLDSGTSGNVDNQNQNYTGTLTGKVYILKVQKYGNKQLIGYAYESISGQLAAATDPSYISTPDQLFSELKQIVT